MIKVENRTVEINGEVLELARELGLIIWNFKKNKDLVIALNSVFEALEKIKNESI